MVSLYEGLEERRLELQTKLDSLKSAKERNKLGQFATPPALAEDVLAMCHSLWHRERGKVRFLDPAVGTGSFYSALRQVFPESTIESALGIELDGAFAEAAKEIWGTTGLRVRAADFTTVSTPERENEKVNFLVCNPPYVRHHHLTAEQKSYLRTKCAERTGIHMNGLAGLYCYFLLLSDAWLAPDALSVWLIPSEFMDVNYGVGIKQYLCTSVALKRIHRFDPSDVQFDDALVSSAVVVFEKRMPAENRLVEFTYGGSLLAPRISERVPLSQIKNAPKWTSMLMKSQSCSKGEAGPCNEPVLGDLFTIKRGIATGANEFFVLERDEAKREGLPAEFLKPILPSPRHIRGNIIDSDNEGFPYVEPNLLLLDCGLSEEVVRWNYPSLWMYLEKGIRRGLPQRYLMRCRTPWYSQEQRPPAPFLSTYMGRGGSDNRPFRFFLNRSKATAANVYLLLYPCATLSKAMGADPTVADTILRFLNAIEPDQMKTEGRVYGGGLHKIEPKELARLSITRLLEAMPDLRFSRPVQKPLFDI